MKNNRIAAALRSLTATPSLESDAADALVTGDGEATVTAVVEEAQTTQADVKGEDAPATAVIVEEDKGPKEESAETTSADAEVITTASQESADESSVVTGDGEQTTVAAVEEAQTTQAEVAKEDAPATAEIVTVDEGPKEESAETCSEDSIPDDVMGVPSQESLTLAALGFALVGGVATAYVGHKAERANQERVKLEELLAKKKAALKAAQDDLGDKVVKGLEKARKEKPEAVKESDLSGLGSLAGLSYTMWFSYIFPYVGTLIGLGIFSASVLTNFSKVKQLGEEIAEIENKIAERQLEILRETQGAAVSNESQDDAAADAAAAFAAGAAGAAEAAAAAAADVAAAPAEVVVEDVPAVVEEAAAEVTADVQVDDAAAAIAEDAAAASDEAAAEVAAVDAVETPEEIAEQEEIAAAEDELVELEADVAEGEEHAEKYEQAAASLESLLDAIGEAQQSGGLTPQSAQFLNIGFESVGVFLTGKPFVNTRGEAPIPSMESFGGTMRRDAATNVSMESVRETLQKVWEVLKKTFQTIKDWIVKFFQAVFSQAERYKQRAAKIKAAASKLRSDAKPKNETFQLAQSIANKIHMGGEVSRWDLHDLVALTQAATTRNTEGTRALMQIRQHMKSIVEEMTKSELSEEELFKMVGARLGIAEIGVTNELRNPAFSVPVTEGEEQGFKTKPLPGGVELMIVDPVSSQSEFSVSHLIMFHLRGARVTELKSEVDVKNEVRTPSGIQIQKIAGDAEKILDMVIAARADFKAEALDLANIQIPTDVTDSQARAIKNFGNAVAKATQRYSAGNSKIFKYLVSTSGAFLDFGAASLKQYGEVEAPAAAEAAAA